MEAFGGQKAMGIWVIEAGGGMGQSLFFPSAKLLPMEDPELTSKFHLSLPLLTEVYRAIALLFKYVPNKRNLLSVLPLRELSVELVLPGLPHELRDVVVLLP